jgi:hypothetical protein
MQNKDFSLITILFLPLHIYQDNFDGDIILWACFGLIYTQFFNYPFLFYSFPCWTGFFFFFDLFWIMIGGSFIFISFYNNELVLKRECS